jgi:hypothetical protein
VRNKTQKITKIFEKLEQLNNQGVTFWAKRMGPVIINVLHQPQSAASRLFYNSIIWIAGGSFLLAY